MDLVVSPASIRNDGLFGRPRLDERLSVQPLEQLSLPETAVDDVGRISLVLLGIRWTELAVVRIQLVYK